MRSQKQSCSACGVPLSLLNRHEACLICLQTPSAPESQLLPILIPRTLGFRQICPAYDRLRSKVLTFAFNHLKPETEFKVHQDHGDRATRASTSPLIASFPVQISRPRLPMSEICSCDLPKILSFIVQQTHTVMSIRITTTTTKIARGIPPTLRPMLPQRLFTGRTAGWVVRGRWYQWSQAHRPRLRQTREKQY
jgi:hypothetical protein